MENLDERAGTRMRHIVSQPVNSSEQDVIRILLAQQQQQEEDSSRTSACNTIMVAVEPQEGAESHETGEALEVASVMENAFPGGTSFLDGNISCEDGSHFRCEVEGCSKVFGTRNTLRCHIRTHTEKKPHTCPQQDCGKGFKSSGDLQKHMQRHTSSDGKRQRSAVWHYFIKSENAGTSHCTVCSDIVKHANNTSNLFKHLKVKHPEQYQQAEKQREEDQEIAAKKRKTGSPKRATPVKLKAEVVQKYPSDSTRRKNIDEAIVRMITVDMHPPSIVDNVGFRSLIQLLDPRYILPSKQHLKKNLLPVVYSKRVDELKQELAQVARMALSCELWASASEERYLTITCHFLNSAWELKSLVLETIVFRKKPSTEIIAGSLKRLAQTWGIAEKVVAVVSDDAAGVVSTASGSIGWLHVPSFANALNLAVSEAVSADASVQELKGKCRQIVSFFYRNMKASEKLLEIQRQLGCSEHKLVQEGEARWTSTFHMFQEIADQYQAITTALCLCNGNELCLSSSDVDNLKAAIAVLKPFEAATAEMAAIRCVFVSKIIPLAMSLEHLTSKISTDQPLVLELKAQMHHLFAGFQRSHLLTMATLLDPRMKKLAFHDSLTARQGELCIIQELSELAPADINQDTQSTDSTSESGLWDLFDAQVAKSHSPNKGTTNARVEAMRFFEEPVLRRNDDPLEWWKAHEGNFPLLSQLAKKYLCIPGSSFPAERLFSKQGELVALKRIRIKPKDVHVFLFLNQNL